MMIQVALGAAPDWTGTQQARNETHVPNYFKSATWSPDGTCVITNSADNHVRTYVIPPDLLEDHDEPVQLLPYSTIASLEPVNTVACYPQFNLRDPATTLILSAASEHPIRLSSALTGDLVASYPLVNASTEAYIKPQCLKFTTDGRTFIAGSGSMISFFDVARVGQEPFQAFKTGPKNNRTSWSNPGTSLQGIVSALDLDDQHNILAAGTFSRQIGLYDSGGRSECIGVFSVADTKADESICGGGITQLVWSGCGRYLYIFERKSDGGMIYDIRQSGQLLSWITGRKAMTNQQMSVEILDSGVHEVWAGGVDGFVRCWNAPQLLEGPIPSAQQYECHKDCVNSVSFHQDGEVFATASGQRHFETTGITDSQDHAVHEKPTPSSNLKLWARERDNDA